MCMGSQIYVQGMLSTVTATDKFAFVLHVPLSEIPLVIMKEVMDWLECIVTK